VWKREEGRTQSGERSKKGGEGIWEIRLIDERKKSWGKQNLDVVIRKGRSKPRKGTAEEKWERDGWSKIDRSAHKGSLKKVIELLRGEG